MVSQDGILLEKSHKITTNRTAIAAMEMMSVFCKPSSFYFELIIETEIPSCF